MAPPPPPPPAAADAAGAAPPAALPRSNTAAKNLSALCACCRDPPLEADPVQHPHEPFMARAIELSRIGGIEKRTGGCFGAVVVRNGVIVGEGYNNVVSCNDPTWHGEMGAIRDAAKNLGTPHLRGAVLYTSSEPCPMCMGAIYWARISKVYYATTVADVKRYGNFDDEDHYAELAKQPHDRDIPSLCFMRAQAVEVWKEFHALPDRCHY